MLSEVPEMICNMTTEAAPEPEPSNARKLIDRLEEWKTTPQGESVLGHRDEGAGWWRAHVETIEWLDELSLRLDQLEQQGRPVAYMRPGVEAARKAVLCTNYPMEGNKDGARPHMSDGDLREIASAAMFVDATGITTLDDAEALLELVPFIEQARRLVESIDVDDGTVRDYLRLLVNEFSRAVYSVGLRGEAEVRRWASELIVALSIYANSGDEEQKNRVSVFLRGFGPKVMRLFARVAPEALAAGVAEKAIEAVIGG